MDKKCGAAYYVSYSESDGVYLRNEIETYCRSHDLNVEYFADLKSSLNSSLKDLDRLLQSVRLGAYPYVVLPSLDHFGQSYTHMIQVLQELEHRNVQVIIIANNVGGSESERKAYAAILRKFAEIESLITRQRILASIKTKRELGIKMGRPTGCKDTKPRKTEGYFEMHRRRRMSKSSDQKQ